MEEGRSNELLGEGNYKLVPWISWDDWCFVRESLFSTSPDPALQRISAWRSRGCLPVIIEVTASIVEIQQKDSHFREGLPLCDLLEDDMLTMLYCMTIIRLVNGIVEKTRKKNEISIGEAADAIGIPRMLIDIRHESSHRDLPSLRLVRLASTKALDWLKAYYWEPQKMAIPYPSVRTANSVKEIKSKIRKFAFSMGVKEVTRSGSPVMGKRSKKDKNKQLKRVLKLYSSFPSEVVSILLEFLLKAQDSVDLIELSDSSQANNSEADTTQLDDWKPLVMKLSNKEPEMLLSLLKAVVQRIETCETLKYDSEGEHLKPEHNSGFHQTEDLSSLFKWLVGNLKDLKSSRRKNTSIEAVISPKEKDIPRSTLVHLLRKCLTVSSLGNNHLTTAASVLAKTTGNHTFVQKLNKLASLHTPYVDTMNETTPVDHKSFYNQHEKFMNQAAKKMEFLKQKVSQISKFGVTKKKNKKWSVVMSWKSCPIGMLPSDIGSSGVVPILDVVDEQANLEECSEKLIVNGKREADWPLGALDDSTVKKRKENECIEDERILEGVKNRLMIGGVWKRVTEDDVSNIASSIRILVDAM